MEEHLGYKKHGIDGNNSGNSRNGYSEKTIKSRFRKTRVIIPRDRNGEFEPQIIKKNHKQGCLQYSISVNGNSTMCHPSNPELFEVCSIQGAETFDG